MANATRWERALVTGASGGIGEAFARQLARAGTHLVLVARSTDKLEALADELRANGPVHVDVLAADLADADQLAEVEERVASVDQPVDLLINNAGYGFNDKFGDIPVEAEEAEIRVNVIALMRLCHAAAASHAGDGRRRDPERLVGRGVPARARECQLLGHQGLRHELQPVAPRRAQGSRGHGHGAASRAHPDGVPTTRRLRDRSARDVLAVGRRGRDGGSGGGRRGATRSRCPGWHNKVLVSSVRVMPMALQRFAANQVTTRFR